MAAQGKEAVFKTNKFFLGGGGAGKSGHQPALPAQSAVLTPALGPSAAVGKPQHGGAVVRWPGGQEGPMRGISGQHQAQLWRRGRLAMRAWQEATSPPHSMPRARLGGHPSTPG